MKKTFLDHPRPILTGMLNAQTREDAVAEVARLRADGAEAYGILLERLLPDQKTRDVIGEIFAAMGDLPIYATNYMRNNTEPHLTWDDLAKGMIEARELGATLIDVPADAFLSTPGEVTYDEGAIARQRALIRELHDMGAEILMSAHVMRHLSKEEVLALAREQISRGADIAKIVSDANSERELYEQMEASLLLTRELGRNFLFLTNGSHAIPHRLLAPTLGGCMTLCVENAREWTAQPPLREARLLYSLTEGNRI